MALRVGQEYCLEISTLAVGRFRGAMLSASIGQARGSCPMRVLHKEYQVCGKIELCWAVPVGKFEETNVIGRLLVEASVMEFS